MLATALRTRLACTTAVGARQAIARRTFVSARPLFNAVDKDAKKGAYDLKDVAGPDTLMPPGGKDGEVPTDFDQATGLERLELLGLLAGVKVFDDAPLESHRKGTMAEPIIVDSYEPYRYVGCTGSPAGSHEVLWMRPSVDQVGRCWECGSVYKVNYLGLEDPHAEHHH